MLQGIALAMNMRLLYAAARKEFLVIAPTERFIANL